MSDYKSFINDFDPRDKAGQNPASRDRDDGEYTPRHARRGMSSTGEYRPRRSNATESKPASPSPVSEGGEDDFDVFNFELARKKKKEREDRLNAAIERQEAPRELVRKMADNAPPRRPSRPPAEPTTDNSVRRAADFVGRLSRYTLTEEKPVPPAGRKERKTENRRSGALPEHKAESSRDRSSTGRSAVRKEHTPFRIPTVSLSTEKRRNYADEAQTRPTGSKPSPSSAVAGYFESLPSPVRWVVNVCVVLLALLVVYYAAVGFLLADMGSLDLGYRKNSPAEEVSSLKLMSGSGVTNILLLGIDDDGSSGSRSDTIMIASVDSRGGTIRLCSILRDCYVAIPGHKSSRINSAYAYGGAQLAVETVENNFRVKIDHCATIDMAALVDVVDAMGGVEIELTSAEANQVNLHSHCGKTTSEGLQLLNGKQAVTYAQIRKIDSDFKRTQRQRTLINAILTKAKSLGPVGLMNLAKAVAPNVATDMSGMEIATIALKALPALSGEMEQMTIPADGKYKSTTVNGMSVLKLDLEANAQMLQEYLYGD